MCRWQLATVAVLAPHATANPLLRLPVCVRACLLRSALAFGAQGMPNLYALGPQLSPFTDAHGVLPPLAQYHMPQDPHGLGQSAM